MNAIHRIAMVSVTLGASLLATAALGADAIVSRDQIDALDKALAIHLDEFAGLSIVEEENKVVVYQVRPQNKQSISNLIATLPVSRRSLSQREMWSVEIRLVSRSQRQLEAVFARIQSTEPWATRVQPFLTGWEIDIEHNVVAIDVTEVTAALVSETNRLFGSAVELRPSEQRKRQYAFTRSNDHASWYSGIPVSGLIPDAVYADQKGLCTAGFAVSDSAGFYIGLITAGHCFGLGRSISQPSDKERVGSVIAGQNFNNSVDFALIGWNPNDKYFGTGFGYGARVWISENNAVGINNPDGTGIFQLPPKVGTVVCFNGARTGERCNAKITSLNSCQALAQFINTCKLVTVKSTNGKRIANHGDSGGPVYTKIDGTVEPVGMIIGGGNDDGTVAFYHKIETVLSALETSPNVGGLPFHVISVGL